MDEHTPEITNKDSDTSTTSSNYAFSGKVMLVSTITLLVFCIVFAVFHFYSRWFLIRRSRNIRTHRRRRFFSDSDAADHPITTAKGLAPTVLKSLPTFLYSAAEYEEPLIECAVCLSEFEDNETGRILPKCSHAFHLECIDMWFLSHSSCPLCRAPVQFTGASGQPSENPAETVITVTETNDSGQRSGCFPMTYSLSSSALPQLLNVTVDIPLAVEGSERRNGLKPAGGPAKSLTRFLSI